MISAPLWRTGCEAGILGLHSNGLAWNRYGQAVDVLPENDLA
jgi:hypothetical protein